MRRILREAMTHRLMALVILATVSSLSLPGSAPAQTNSVSWGAGQPTTVQDKEGFRDRGAIPMLTDGRLHLST
jgi:hypothetical protein